MTSLKSRFPDRVLIQRGDLALSYRARDTRLDRDVFIKVLNPALADDTEIRARFEREAKAVARLDHPNLVRIYEYGQDADEGLYMLLEWVEGSNLAHYLIAHGCCADVALRVLAHDLLSGLAALHSVGIVHRDLKPENVLCKSEHPSANGGEVQFKITDFSLAALTDAPSLTHHEAIVGTPAYMSPEQAAGARVNEKSDLFALGVMLYEAATGENPFVSHSMLDTMRKIRESDISFAHTHLNALSPSLKNLISALLHKEPSRRPPSAKVALDWLEQDAVPVRVNGSRATRKTSAYFIAAALIGAIILAVLMMPKTLTIPDSAQVDSVMKVDTARREAGALTDNNVPPDCTKITAPEQAHITGIDIRTPRNEGAGKANPALSLPPQIADTMFTVNTMVDSTDLMLITEPWAHVYYQNQRLATTPLEIPLRLPGGNITLALRNPAFPEIDIPLNLNQKSLRHSVHLTDYVTQLQLSVIPWGECFLDGDAVGTTPLAKPLYVTPGRHSLRLVHPSYSAIVRDISARAGQTMSIKVDFSTGEFVANGLSTPQ